MVGLEASGWAAGPPTTGQQCLPPLAQQKVGYLRPGFSVEPWLSFYRNVDLMRVKFLLLSVLCICDISHIRIRACHVW